MSSARIILIILGILISMEIGIRTYEASLDGTVGILPSYLVHRDGYWVFQPNLTLIQPERYGDVLYRFNEQGFRDESHTADPHRCAILFVGDSVTFGLGSPQEARFTELVADGLPSTHGACNYQAVSLSQPGYGPAEELAATVDLGLSYRPHLIVLQLYMNDFAPASKDAAFAENDGFMRGVAVATNWLFAHSSFLRRLRQWQLGMVYFSTHDLRRRYFPETLNATELEAKKAAFESIAGENVGGFSEVEKIAQIAREHRIELLAVLTPNEVQLYREDFDGINTRIRDFCSSKHIEFYDPLPALRAHALKAQVFLDGLHFSPIGHAFIAEWMLPFIKEHLYLTSQRGIEEPG